MDSTETGLINTGVVYWLLARKEKYVGERQLLYEQKYAQICSLHV